MTDTERSLTDVLELEGRAGSYVARIDDSWTQGRTLFGGVTGACLLEAATRDLPPDLVVRSVLTTFVGPAAAGSLNLDTSVLRRGRSLTHVRVDAEQDGALCATAIVVLGASRQTGLALAGPSAQHREPLEAARPVPQVEGVTPRFLRHFDLRPTSKGMFFSGASEAKLSGYVRHATPAPGRLASTLALLDAWPPAIFPMLRQPAPASTVSWMVEFVGAAPQDEDPQAMHYYESNGVVGYEGCASCDARLWSASGELRCVSRQMVAEFSRP